MLLQFEKKKCMPCRKAMPGKLQSDSDIQSHKTEKFFKDFFKAFKYRRGNSERRYPISFHCDCRWNVLHILVCFSKRKSHHK